jgi:signal transduction histidine kinase
MDLSSLARDYVIDIRKAAQRAAELCKHMLDYSGKSRLTVKALNLNRTIEDMANLLESSLSSGITLSYELSESVPFIEADPVQIRQVVMNLITNAAEAIGGEKGEIRLRTGFANVKGLDISRSVLGEHLPDGRYPFVEVSDTGCGMEADVQRKIFEPFFTTKFTGRGMGLASVIGIVRGHGGAIVVDSKPGSGSTFQVFFPHRGTRVDPERTGGPSKRPDSGEDGT